MRTWIKPSAIEENFASNQNTCVNPCVSLYCMVAGDGKGGFKENTYFHYGPNGSGYNQKFNWGIDTGVNAVKPDGNWHGAACAKGSSYNPETGTFYEWHKKVRVSTNDIHISNITDSSVPNGYQATWKSTDTDGTIYTHYGYAINNATDKPNHS